MTATTRQQHILAYIQRYHAEHGYVPALREICDACEISSTSVARYNLLALQDQGHLTGLAAARRGTSGSGRARGYQLVQPDRLLLKLPAGLSDLQRGIVERRLAIELAACVGDLGL